MDRDSRAAAAIVRARGEAGRHAVCLGIPAGDLRLLAPAGGDALSRFAAADGRAGGPAPDAIDAGGDGGGAGAAGGVGGTRPNFVVDGLGEYNPHLALGAFDDLRAWMADYREVGRSGQSVIYQRVR